jgi:hypothetical protein
MDREHDMAEDKMPPEPPIGRLLRSSFPEAPSGLDAEGIISRSRQRRRSRLIGIGAISTLLVFGVIGGGLVGISQLTPSTGITSAAEGSAHDLHAVPKPAQPPQANQAAPSCGSPLPAAVPAPDGLTVTVSFPSASVGTKDVPGVVTLTNGGTEKISGTASSPTIVLSRNGTAVWQTTTTDSAGHVVELAPGQSMTLRGDLMPVDCAARNAPAGRYSVSGTVDVRLATGVTVTVTGPASTFTLN